MKTQSRRASFIESVTNTTVGYFVALATQFVVFPLLGIPVRLSQNIIIGLVFTVVSIVRSYCLRRAFNLIHAKGWTL